MLNELGNEPVDNSSIQMASVSNDIDASNKKNYRRNGKFST